MTKRSCAVPIGSSISVPARAATAAASWPKERRPRSPPIRPRSPAAIWPAWKKSLCQPRGRSVAMTRAITIEGATTNNLKNVTADVPAFDVDLRDRRERIGQKLAPERHARAGVVPAADGRGPKPGPYTSLRGASQIDKLVEIDQSPIGRTPRSNPATYTGVFDEIRKVFATTRDARALGLQVGPLQLQQQGRPLRGMPGPRAAADRDELPARPLCDLPGLRGQAVQPADAGDPLSRPLDCRRARSARRRSGRVLREPPGHRPAAGQLAEVGLGYVTLGQSSLTLSGGEAQRIKLATELGRVDTGKTFYILDEPTTGLHFDDIKKLLAVLGRLVDLGNTVVVIEHNLDVMKTADWIIDLGPEGGDGGGQIIATGTPEQVAAMEGNVTGRFLRDVLDAEDMSEPKLPIDAVFVRIDRDTFRPQPFDICLLHLRMLTSKFLISSCQPAIEVQAQ